MPNWCESTLIITGNKKDLQRFKKEAKGYKTALSLDKLYPMPEALSFISAPATVLSEKEYEKEIAKIKRMEKKEPKNEYWKCGYPITKRMKKEYLERYGACDWYSWRVSNWGTKWDIEAHLEREGEHSLRYCFDSAWAPPIDCFVKASVKFPHLKFNLKYEEPGMGFKGRAVVKTGELLEDIYHDM